MHSDHEHHEHDEQHVEPIEGHFTDLGEATLVPPQWVIEDLLPPGLVFVGAPPKAMKSTIEMAMALLVAGLPCRALPPHMSKVPRPGTVLGFSYEANAGELRHMCEHGLKVKIPNDRRILIADDPWLFRLDDPDGVNKLLFWLDERKPRLCFLDPLRDFHSLEEKDSGGMNRMLRPLQKWAKDHEASMLVVHHTKKKDEGDYTANDLRGTTAIFGIADGVLMITPRANGQLNIKATFKRAKGWDRTIRLAAYDFAEEAATEILGDVEATVFKLIKGGAPNIDAIAKQLRLGKDRVVSHIQALARNGLIEKVDRKWRPTKGEKWTAPAAAKDSGARSKTYGTSQSK